MKCPECGHEWDEDDCDEKIAQRAFITDIVSDINA